MESQSVNRWLARLEREIKWIGGKTTLEQFLKRSRFCSKMMLQPSLTLTQDIEE